MREVLVEEKSKEPEQPEEQALPEDAERELIESFESLGFAVFRAGEDRAAFDALDRYIRKHSIPTYTDVDKKTQSVTITKRPFGSLELF